MITLAASQSHKFSERLKRIPKNIGVRTIVCKHMEKSSSQLHSKLKFMLMAPCFCKRLLTKAYRLRIFENCIWIWIEFLWYNNTYVSFWSSLRGVGEHCWGFWIKLRHTRSGYLYLLGSISEKWNEEVNLSQSQKCVWKRVIHWGVFGQPVFYFPHSA